MCPPILYCTESYHESRDLSALQSTRSSGVKNELRMLIGRTGIGYSMGLQGYRSGVHTKRVLFRLPLAETAIICYNRRISVFDQTEERMVFCK